MSLRERATHLPLSFFFLPRTCRAPCNDQIYQSRIAFAAYPNRALFSKRKEVCLLVKKLDKICTGWLDPEVRETGLACHT